MSAPPRPVLHVTADRGWLNDPNGLIEHQGRHHWFFQHNPHATVHRDIGWGHVSSPDLLHWQQHPDAMAPDRDYDRDGCWSGVSVPTADGIAVVYTGLAGRDTLPCLARFADDGLLRVDKDADNPVVAAPPPGADPVTDFRDHAVTQVDGGWQQVVAGARRDAGGTLFAYTSPDLRAWTYRGDLLDARGCAVPGTCWECPDLFVLDGRQVAVVSVIDADRHAVWWATGTQRDHRLAVTACGPVDGGDRLYAPQSYATSDGRRIMVGWLRTFLDGPTPAGYVGALSLPRELLLHDGRLVQRPARELSAARGPARTEPAGSRICVDSTAVEIAVPAAAGCTGLTVYGAGGPVRHIDWSGLVADPAWPVPVEQLRVFLDAGIVEVFVAGRAGAWSHRIDSPVVAVEFVHAGPAGGRVTVWPMAPRPDA